MNNSSPVQWPAPGVIYSQEKLHHVNVPSPLLCMNLIVWAEHRLSSLREQVMDSDYTPSERTSWLRRAAEMESWLARPEGPISYHTHELLCLRSEAHPWVVGCSDLSSYLERHVLPVSSPWSSETAPYFAIWSDSSRCAIYVSHASLFRTAVEFSSPEVAASLVTQEELERIIGQMVIAADDALIERRREKRKKSKR